jgi:hypothetical protein
LRVLEVRMLRQFLLATLVVAGIGGLLYLVGLEQRLHWLLFLLLPLWFGLLLAFGAAQRARERRAGSAADRDEPFVP